MPIDFAIELINAATIRAFDTAVGSNRQKYARVAIPGFVRGAAAVQRQVGRSNNDGRLCLVGHGGCPYWAVGVVAGTFGSSRAASVAYYRLDILPCRLMPYDGMSSELTKTSTALARLAVTCVLSAARRLVLI